MTTARYTIDGGAPGKARLDVLARVCADGTSALLDRVGVPTAGRCVDVGCGGGHVARELATRVGAAGSVVGIDLDPVVVDLARRDAAAAALTNLTFRVCDATRLEPSTYDVAYARCLLSHVREPAQVVSRLAAALKPDGIAILEDIDFAGYVCEPPSESHDRYVTLYRETVRRRGGNADLGPALPTLLLEAGLEDVRVHISQPCALEGDPKLIPPLTLERIADAVVSEGVATMEEIEETVGDLYAYAADATTVMGMPRLVQAWGRKPG